MYPFRAPHQNWLQTGKDALLLLALLIGLWVGVNLLFARMGVNVQGEIAAMPPLEPWRAILIILTALGEEFLFRGWLLYLLRERLVLPAVLAGLLSALAFAILHTPDLTRWQFIWPLGAGLLFGGVTLWRKAWGSAALAHLCLNIMSLQRFNF